MATSAIPTGTAQQSTLSEWSGPFVTDMLGKAKAISETPYQTYQGPMTAGASDLQSKVFQGLGNLTFPSNLGKSFSSTGAYQPPMMAPNAYGVQPIGTGSAPNAGANFDAPTWLYGGSQPTGLQAGATQQPGMAGMDMNKFAIENTNFPTAPTGQPFDHGLASGMAEDDFYNRMAGNTNVSSAPTGIQQNALGQMPASGGGQQQNIAQQYMNPYLQAVLDPQLAELRRQNDITNMKTNAGLTSQGAFGGGRQAIMNAENARNLMQEMNKTVGQGYANAYDKAMQQFNTEQGQAKDLAGIMSGAGATQRDIEQQGITADYNEFLAQRDYPMKQVQFLQSMLQGLPISTVSATQLPQSGIGQLSTTIGGLGTLMDNLKKLGIGP